MLTEREVTTILVLFLHLLIVLGIVVGCLIVIVMSVWFTAKLGGSTGLVWGTLLGVATVYVLPVSSLWGRRAWFPFWDPYMWYQRVLPEAAAGAALACLLNLIIWHRRHRQKQT